MSGAAGCNLGRDERGFTIIELMVVLLIIAVLIAIVMPTFLGARAKAQDRAAQVDLRQALLTEKTFFSDAQTYVATPGQLTSLEPSIKFDDNIANATQSIVGYAATATTIVMAKQSSSGKFFCIADGPGTTYGGGSAITDVDTVVECNAGSW